MLPDNPTIGDMIALRFGRRDLLRGMLATSAVAAIAPLALAANAEESRFSFDEIAHGVDDKHHVAKGYRADILLRWGDPIVAGARSSILRSRAPPPRRGSSATTTTMSALPQSMRTAASSASTTNMPCPKSCFRE